MAINIIIMVLFVLAALWTVMSRSLLRGAAGLAIVSAILAVLLFRINSPIAAVFELSVCAGLIPVIFVTTVSLTEPMVWPEIYKHMWMRLRRYWMLPLILIIAGIVLTQIKFNILLALPAKISEPTVGQMLWNLRPADLLGQVIILLAGSIGIVVLFKEKK
jgi:NADH-quinone oxidoreductase subunit J